jgi:hypothetical protein
VPPAQSLEGEPAIARRLEAERAKLTGVNTEVDMRLVRSGVLCAALGVCCLGLAPKAKPDDKLDPAVTRLVTQIATASKAADAATGYAHLFKSPDRKLTRLLKGGAHQGIALRAAWEEVLLEAKFPKNKANPKLNQPLAVARFFGFVEGRLSLALPVWWEETIQDAFLGGCGRVVPGQPKTWPYQWVRFGNTKIGMPQGQSIRRGEMGVALCSGDDRAAVSEDVVKKHLKFARHLSFLIDKEFSFVALHDNVGTSYELLCLERKSGRQVWKATVWDWAYSGATTGAWQESVAVVGKGERVYVIGAGVFCFYIEAFDRATGRNAFRFANWYADELDVKKK